jgi:hypothetical protein
VHDRFPDQIRLDAAAKHVVAQVERADLLFIDVYDVDLHSCQLSAVSGQLPAISVRAADS